MHLYRARKMSCKGETRLSYGSSTFKLVYYQMYASNLILNREIYKYVRLEIAYSFKTRTKLIYNTGILYNI